MIHRIGEIRKRAADIGLDLGDRSIGILMDAWEARDFDSSFLDSLFAVLKPSARLCPATAAEAMQNIMDP